MVGILGIVTLLTIAFLISKDRKAINYRTICGAWLLQVGFALLVLYIPVGREALQGASDFILTTLNYGQVGSGFMFGDLAHFKLGFIFAINALPVIVFFSALVAVLYHFGIMQVVINVVGRFLQKLLHTSQAESLSATSNIFIGQTEAPLIVRPYIAKMTDSELFAVMTGGLASIAGTVLGGFAQLGVQVEILIAASFMAAPGGLLMAKIIYPETQASEDPKGIEMEASPAANFVEAAANGASSGLQLALNIGAMLIAFVSLIALANGILGGVGHWFGVDQLSLELIFGYLFAPVAFVLGVPWNEAVFAGSFLGQKVIFNEFVAYQSLSPYLNSMQEGVAVIAETGLPMSQKTQVILSYALCGFANISSVAILLGGLGTIAPSRRDDIARMGFKAVIAGSMSNFMSAAIAGIIFSMTL
jgi:CNT family concentrative nucleoside transporter